jgi:hypothetical protein
MIWRVGRSSSSQLAPFVNRPLLSSPSRIAPKASAQHFGCVILHSRASWCRSIVAASISPVMITATNQRAAIIVRPRKRSVFIFLIGLRGPGRLTSVKLPENAAFGPLIARAHSNEDTKGCERECRRSGLRYHEADTLCAISLNPSLLGMAGLYACFMRRFTRTKMQRLSFA